ncbi:MULTISPECIES: urate hydroxylase PuuD [Halocynthiibacter]|uniref:Urate hydroxylase PuuD n=1 Tax=Halocynthiibacter halioticoli TaxID=2986804 RepID=A0AAE3J113_9RHOB|nr:MULTISPECIES: urate hydroxylase PuuD [Halocynthiibacter]MCV6824543.1 urate hydroxylase PuuD [Halocynthiibacter halioticoli]MCW4057544.1 urate hydroxylase PuuD [Halocynthiibacter sp. SDUM655004]
MYDMAIIWDWIAFSVRWLHVITAMAWIGASFYFIALDLMLKPNKALPEGAYGEEWEVHGGGFYHTVKYLVAPAEMPEHLTWHKWQSYMTWISGAALLMIVYWVGGELFLIDPSKADLALWQGILISGGSLTIGWLAYDQLCKSKLGESPTVLMLILFAILVVMSWGYNQIFTGRAALLHLGAFTATIMTGNVFFQIMPNQRIVVADLKAGRTPDAKYGKIAKLRSTHNNYLTLPVVFLMLSNHYPLAFGTEYAWLIASLIFLTGVTIRHYFNTMHRTGKGPNWTWLATAVLMIAIAYLSTFSATESYEEAEARVMTPYEEKFASSEKFEDAYYAVVGNCSMCHAREPSWDGMHWAPKGVILETEADVARHAEQIYLQAGRTHAMPPPNAIEMDNEARAMIVAWIKDVRQNDG